MRLFRDRSGVAALEMAFVAPVLITVLVASIDFGAAMLAKAQVTNTLAASAAYATLAGQNQVAQATIVTNAKSLAGGLQSPFLGTPTVTAVVNNGAATGSACCPGTGWSCSTAANFTCADGATPGTYITITVSYPFLALIAADTRLVSKILTDHVTAVLQ